MQVIFLLAIGFKKQPISPQFYRFHLHYTNRYIIISQTSKLLHISQVRQDSLFLSYNAYLEKKSVNKFSVGPKVSALLQATSIK